MKIVAITLPRKEVNKIKNTLPRLQHPVSRFIMRLSSKTHCSPPSSLHNFPRIFPLIIFAYLNWQSLFECGPDYKINFPDLTVNRIYLQCFIAGQK